MKNSHAFLIVALAILASATATHAADYQLSKTIPVGGDGGWDYLSVDSAAHRLYVSHATKVVVIDTATEKVIGEITNTLGVHGIAVAPELNRGFVSCGKENMVAVVDLQTLQTLSKIATGKNPDAIVYEPKQQEVYTFNGKSDDATVIDAKSGKVVTTIPLGGKPEFAQEDAEAGRIFVNIETKSEIAAIEIATHKVVANWSIAPGDTASGLAIDLKRHRLFAGCDNKLMVMLDYSTGKVVGSVPIAEGVDANAFDPDAQLAFASCGEGTTTIAHEDGNKLTTVQTLKTAKGARTMTIDPATHKIYLAAADYPAGTEGERRPKMVAGSFKILVFGPEK
jgi:YVTN family beta-propeller protein